MKVKVVIILFVLIGIISCEKEDSINTVNDLIFSPVVINQGSAEKITLDIGNVFTAEVALDKSTYMENESIGLNIKLSNTVKNISQTGYNHPRDIGIAVILLDGSRWGNKSVADYGCLNNRCGDYFYSRLISTDLENYFSAPSMAQAGTYRAGIYIASCMPGTISCDIIGELIGVITFDVTTE